MVIRKITYQELPLVRNFPPPDWHLDLANLYRQFYGRPLFRALVAEDRNSIIGTGMVVINSGTAWLGTIIVLPEYRGRGIGAAITAELMNIASRQGCANISLFATEMGFPVYQKLGFITDMQYQKYSTAETQPVFQHENIRKITKSDHGEILALDRHLTGESRELLLPLFLKTGFKYILNKKIAGFYLPDFGDGLVLVDHPEAGLALLQYKMSCRVLTITLPESNGAAIDLLKEKGFAQTHSLPRMYFGEKVNWRPESVWSRGTGYMG